MVIVSKYLTIIVLLLIIVSGRGTISNFLKLKWYRYFLGFLISLLLLGLGELGGFLIIFIVNFGEGIDSGRDTIGSLLKKINLSCTKPNTSSNNSMPPRNSYYIFYALCSRASMFSYLSRCEVINKLLILKGENN